MSLLPDKRRIVVIDDEQNILQFVQFALEEEGYKVDTYLDPIEALASLGLRKPDLVISDIRLPNMDGFSVLKNIKEKYSDLNVVLITAHATVDSAIDALRGGAYDYLVKPFKIGDLRLAVKRAISAKRLTTLGVDEKNRITLIGSSQEIKQVIRAVKKVALSESTVLIGGESGTGKELVAQMIHSGSSQAEGSFVSINCAALPEALLESELFGYEKGAFTGADKQKIGLFEFASGGTIFLDEIGELSLALQARLLRVLQEKSFKRVGGVVDISVETRVLSATNKNLLEEVRNGAFREDLFYRLNVIPITIPPLRERLEDLQELIFYFLNKKQQGNNKGGLQFGEGVMDVLKSYSWPGNVRELEHFVERLLVLSDDNMITLDTLSELFGETFFKKESTVLDEQKIRSFDEEKEVFEKELIAKTLEKTSGNKLQAAKLLQLTRQNFQYKLKKYGLR